MMSGENSKMTVFGTHGIQNPGPAPWVNPPRDGGLVRGRLATKSPEKGVPGLDWIGYDAVCRQDL